MATQIPISEEHNTTLSWVWENLVPKSGQAEWVQGEVLRAIEKLRWEARNNGNGNWDKDFDFFVYYLREFFSEANGFSTEKVKQLNIDLDRLADFDAPYTENDLYDRLGDALAEYCHINPLLIKRDLDPNLRR